MVPTSNIIGALAATFHTYETKLFYVFVTKFHFTGIAKGGKYIKHLIYIQQALLRPL
jgi:hypothetical protein